MTTRTTTDQAKALGELTYRKLRGVVSTCPYEREELRQAWHEGYCAAKNNRQAVPKESEDKDYWKPFKEQNRG